MKEINEDLKRYIEKEVFPYYEKNDIGHNLSHITYVIDRSMKFASLVDDINLDMVYTIAAMHDIAVYIDRDNHEKLSAEMLLNDKNLRKFFDEEQIKIMAEAVEDHRASKDSEPRSIYGKIISSADRFVTIEGIMRSTHSYTLEFLPEVDWDQMVETSYSYIKKKYGKNGYAKSYIPNPDYDSFLEEVEKYLNDRELFSKKLLEVDELLRKEYPVKVGFPGRN